MRKIAYLVLLLWGFGASIPAVAQAPIHLSPIRHICKGVDEWPLILRPKNDEERSVNKYLSDLNAQLAHSLKDCDADREQSNGKQNRSSGRGDEQTEYVTQHTRATMLGPVFLSLVATAEFYCGGAHPYGFTSAAVFDLRTGEPADPLTWFMPSFKVSLADEDEVAHALEKSVSSVALLETYRDATHHECDDTYADDQPFLLWPNANAGKVMIQADRPPGCCEACGIETGLTLEQARKLGFSEAFLQAIQDAHEQLAHR